MFTEVVAEISLSVEGQRSLVMIGFGVVQCPNGLLACVFRSLLGRAITVVDENPYAAPAAQASTESAGESASGVIDVRGIRRRWVIAVSVCGLAVGAVSRFARDFVTGPVHYDALVAMIFLAIMCVAVLGRFWRFPLAKGKTALHVALFCLWAAFAMGWSAVHGRFWGDIFGVSIAWWIGSAVVGALLLRIPHVRYVDSARDAG